MRCLAGVATRRGGHGSGWRMRWTSTPSTTWTKSPFPVHPSVFTGIGHETDLSVADLVALAFKHSCGGRPRRPTCDRALPLAEWGLAVGQRAQHRLAWERTRMAKDLQTLVLQPRQLLAARGAVGPCPRTIGSAGATSLGATTAAHQAFGHHRAHPSAGEHLGRGLRPARRPAIRDVEALAVNDALSLQFHRGSAGDRDPRKFAF